MFNIKLLFKTERKNLQQNPFAPTTKTFKLFNCHIRAKNIPIRAKTQQSALE